MDYAGFKGIEPFNHIAAPYKALQKLSEQARYLSPGGTDAYTPLNPPEDIQQAEELFETVKVRLEQYFDGAKIELPWK
jgi:hypothetical protein